MKRRIRTLALASVFVASLASAAYNTASADHDVEHRIAAFWQRVNAMAATDHLTAQEIGQWAQNLIDRDRTTRLTVADFRAIAATMQAGFDRAAARPTATATPTLRPVAGVQLVVESRTPTTCSPWPRVRGSIRNTGSASAASVFVNVVARLAVGAGSLPAGSVVGTGVGVATPSTIPPNGVAAYDINLVSVESTWCRYLSDDSIEISFQWY